MSGENLPELDESGEVVDKRAYYCPECGGRYETAGLCSGASPEGGHAPVAVEKVKGGQAEGDTSPTKKSTQKRKSASRASASRSSSRKRTAASA